ncbi:MAG: transglutaminase-like domain-containing protein [Phycisphaerales bacterium]
MPKHAHTVISLGLMALLIAAGPALGQLTKKDREEEKEKDRKREAAKQAALNAPPPPPTEPMSDRVLVLERSKDWTMAVDVRVVAATVQSVVDGQVIEGQVPFKFSSAALVFPMLTASASHRLEMDSSNVPRYTGELRFNGAVLDATPTFVEGYAAGTKLARWEMRDVEGNDAQLHVEYKMTCWNTVFDEDLARTIPWPKGAWPAVAASALKPQMFIESDDPAIKDLVTRLLNGQDPKAQPPVVVAKHLAGEVLKMAQPSGDGLVFNKNSSFRGFLLKGAVAMAADGKGSSHDVACLLTAVYRGAGLPARVVIGYDKEDAQSGKSGGLIRNSSGPSNLRSWVEFALVDPFDNKVFWVPVDVVRLRRVSSRPPSFDSPWRFFGTHDELNGVLPLAFGFHPPTTVTAMSPAFWGWLTTPETGMGEQSLRFTAFRTPQRGDEPSRMNRPAPKGDR